MENVIECQRIDIEGQSRYLIFIREGLEGAEGHGRSVGLDCYNQTYMTIHLSLEAYFSSAFCFFFPLACSMRCRPSGCCWST